YRHGPTAPSEVPTEDRLIALPGQGRKNSRKGGSKNSESFLIPLSKQALAILEKRKPRENSEYVFGMENALMSHSFGPLVLGVKMNPRAVVERRTFTRKFDLAP